jgi:hypothetical protein
MCKVLCHHAITTATHAATSISDVRLNQLACGFLRIIAATYRGTRDVKIRAALWSYCLQDKPADDGQGKDAVPKSLDPMAQPPHGTEVGTAASRACPASRGLQADHLCVVQPQQCMWWHGCLTEAWLWRRNTGMFGFLWVRVSGAACTAATRMCAVEELLLLMLVPAGVHGQLGYGRNR